jgi:putative phosphoserine phosphatase/1-acylglycerol-3-phosphate O-acyltransferase
VGRDLGIDLDQSFFYSDSDDDIQLLERVGRPQPLNPNAKLTEIAEEHGWPIRRFKSRGQPGLFSFLRSVAATASLVPTAMAGLPIWALTGSEREARNFATSLFADISSALIGLNLVIRGEENLWSQRRAVFVFNHQSKADVVIMARLLRRDIAGVGKKEIRRIPLIGRTMELAGTVFIDRANAASAIEAMQPLVDALRNEGKSVVIAPEGTRTVSPRLAPFKKGAFHLAMQAGVPIVPVVVHNAGDVAPKGDFVFRPATVEVDVLPPVDTSGWRPETIEKHVAEVRAMFSRVLGQEDQELRPATTGPEAEIAPAAPRKAARVVKKKAPRRKQAKPAAKPEKAPAAKPAKKVTAAKPANKAPAAGPPKKKARIRKAPKKKASKEKASARKATARKPMRPKPQRKKVLPAKAAGERPADSKGR